jgi:hypothetical protein
MKKVLNILKIYREERWIALAATIIFALLNSLTVIRYYGTFSQLTDNYHKLFVQTFRVSGFDPLTYEVLSNWCTAYNVYRHPLLAFFMWPLNQINQGLMLLTDTNFATIVAAIFLVACSVYSCLFLFRIFTRVVEIRKVSAYILCFFYFGFAYIMLSSMVPDHFIMSMTALLLTLYIAGMKLKRGSALNAWQTILLFFFTAGISLNNGLKVFLAALVTRRKKFFRPGFLLLAVALPSLLMWGFARWEYRTYVWPKEMARHEIKMRKDREHTAQIRSQVRDSIGAKDSAAVEKMVRKIKQQKAVETYRANRKKIWNRNTGKPFAKGEFMRWTDKTTERIPVCVENLFGEAIQLHEQNLLGDVLRNRPVIVRYSYAANYIVEAAIVLLFVLGVWFGRKSRFLWTALSFMLMDVALHVGLGFGINEIYIMSAHYMFVLPIATAFLVKASESASGSRRWASSAVTVLILLLALWCWIWNVRLILHYFSFV